MELWRKGTAGTTGDCLYPDPRFMRCGIFQKSSDEDELLNEAMDAFERTQQVGGAAATFKGHEVTRT